MDILDDTLARMREELLNGSTSWRSEETYDNLPLDPDAAEVVRVRFDLELPSDGQSIEDALTTESRVDQIIEVLRSDLTNLIINGDRRNVSDPLLSYLDGEEVRQCRAVLVNIFGWDIYISNTSDTDTHNYTLICLIAFRFEG